MAEIIYQRHWQRRDTAANLAAINEVLYSGEFCVETDTLKFKIGDGETPWNDLPYCGVLNAAALPYDPASSGLAAIDVQSAIDEVASRGLGPGTDTTANAGPASALPATPALYIDFVHEGVTYVIPMYVKHLGYRLLENGSYRLLESGDKLKLE